MKFCLLIDQKIIQLKFKNYLQKRKTDVHVKWCEISRFKRSQNKDRKKYQYPSRRNFGWVLSFWQEHAEFISWKKDRYNPKKKNLYAECSCMIWYRYIIIAYIDRLKIESSMYIFIICFIPLKNLNISKWIRGTTYCNHQFELKNQKMSICFLTLVYCLTIFL